MVSASTLLLLAACVAPVEKRIALTFDDIPRHAGAFLTPDERAELLIEGMRRAGVEQAGFFVTTGNLEKPDGEGGEARIEAYTDAGHVIANHSTTHPWLSRTEADDYLVDIDGAERWLEGRAGHRAWFRFPYLDEGRRDQEKRDAVRAGLADRGLMNAYVTVDNYDWHLDWLASRAEREGREIDRVALGELFVETMVQAAEFYDEIAVRTLGRSPAHVLLLHETDVAALYIEELVAGFEEAGWRIVSVDEAYEDPLAAEEPDTWFLGSGRVAALAHIAGDEPRTLVHERTDEAALEALFEERVLVPPRP